MQPINYKTNNKRFCNVIGWFMSEKLDGMKGRWIKGKFLTRSGKEIKAPNNFLKLLPNFDIEGELYFGKCTIQKTGSLRKDSLEFSSKSWENVCFYVFDHIDYDLTWAERQHKLNRIKQNKNIKIIEWKVIDSINALEKEYNNVIQNKGEGLIIADPWGLYLNGYAECILKYKALQDSEAVLIGYREDQDKKRLVSFQVKKGNIIFNIGTGLKISDRYNYKSKFPIGSLITYKYEQESESGKPRTPIFKGLRLDLN